MDRSFLRHAAVYGLATVLVQAGGFILLPIYLRCLGPEDFGVLEIAGRLAETVAAVLLLTGFRQALFAFHQQANDETERRRVVTGAFLLVGGFGLAGGLGLAGLGPWLGAWLGGGTTTLSGGLVALAVAGVLLEPLSLLPLTLIQARVESGVYILVVVAQFALRVGLCIFLVRFLHWGVAGALTATALTGAVFGLTLTARELARGIRWPGLERLRAMLVFAFPLVPGALCYFLLNHGDRFFLLRYAGAADVGTYALGYKLASIVRLFSLVPLHMVWSSRMYEAAKGPDAANVFARAFTRILAAYLFVGLGLCLFAGEVVHLLGGPAYAGAVPIVAPIVLACYFQAAATLLDAAFFVRRRTGLKLGVTVAATLVMLLLYAVLIPPWGAMGAALATLGGFFFLAVATYLATQRIFPVHYEWSRLTGLIALTAGLWLAGSGLPPGGWSLAARMALVLAAPVGAWSFGLIHEEERRFLREAIWQPAV